MAYTSEDRSAVVCNFRPARLESKGDSIYEYGECDVHTCTHTTHMHTHVLVLQFVSE